MTAFARYPVTPETIWANGAKVAKSGQPVAIVAASAARGTVPAVASVSDTLIDPIETLAPPLSGDGEQLHSAAGFAGAAVNSWGMAVSVYNAKIDALNQEHAATRKNGGDATALQDVVRRKGLADDDLDASAADIAAMLGRGPNATDWNTLASVGAVPANYATYAKYQPTHGPGEPGDPHFVIGPPTKPHIEWDEDFIYGSKDSTVGDWFSWQEWQMKLKAAQLGKPSWDDATRMYDHYLDNTGTAVEFDYEEAYKEDGGVRSAVDNEIARAQQGAEELIGAGHTDFSMTGDATQTSEADYPETENWQKAIGGHQQWSSADVSVEGNTVTMTVTVHGEDHYNFNRDQNDIGSGTPDEENGRFTEIGWAKPFDSHGTVTRTLTWELGEAGDTTDVEDTGDDERNTDGREDR